MNAANILRLVVTDIVLGLVISILSFLDAPCSHAQETNCTPRPSGLIGWWTGDGTAIDLARTNHGKLMNGAAYASGKVGAAFCSASHASEQ